MAEFVGISRSVYDTFVVVDRGDGTTTTLPKRVYIEADYRPSYDRLPVLQSDLEDADDA